MSAGADDEDRRYRELIDRLVDDCKNGQGQIAPYRARAGVWHAAATPDFLEDQFAINQVLTRMSASDREILAGMLEQAFVGGAHAALVALHEMEFAPFDKAYEGTPFHDFVGRLDDWQWPEQGERE